MHLFSLVPIISLALRTSALPYTLSQINARWGDLYTLSSCRFDPHFFGHHMDTVATRVGKVEVIITNKATEEKGDLGSGLHDNLNGECGRNQITNWQPPSVLDREQWTARVLAYSVWFDFGPSNDPSCITRAIEKAEGQSVRCTLP